jgi:hypothetical protein
MQQSKRESKVEIRPNPSLYCPENRLKPKPFLPEDHRDGIDRPRLTLERFTGA